MICLNPTQRFNPEAQEFLPFSLPYQIYQLSWAVQFPYTASGAPLFLAFFPRLPLPLYDTHHQPHSPLLPSTVSAINDDAAHGVGTVLNNLSPRGPSESSFDRRRSECYGGKSLIRKSGGYMTWVPKRTKWCIEVVRDSVRSSPSPQRENGVVRSVGKTTVMIRNIPNQYRRNMLLEILDNLCFLENQKKSEPFRFEYDFVYLPMDFWRGNNLGYAFVNFTCANAASRIHELLHYFKWSDFKDINGGLSFPKKKVCEIAWARIQGKEELVRHFRNSNFACRNVEYLPVVFSPPRDSANSAALPTVVGRFLQSS